MVRDGTTLFGRKGKLSPDKLFWQRVFHSAKECRFHRVDALSGKEVCYRGDGIWPFTKGYTDCRGICPNFEKER